MISLFGLYILNIFFFESGRLLFSTSSQVRLYRMVRYGKPPSCPTCPWWLDLRMRYSFRWAWPAWPARRCRVKRRWCRMGRWRLPRETMDRWENRIYPLVIQHSCGKLSICLMIYGDLPKGIQINQWKLRIWHDIYIYIYYKWVCIKIGGCSKPLKCSRDGILP